MMLRRRIPSPVPALTKRPSSSGPRCTIAWHMRRTKFASIRSPATELTTPAIPHISIPSANDGWLSTSTSRHRLPPPHRYGNFGYVQIFQPTAFKPAKYFLVGVLRLIPRRIPIECIQHPPSPVAVAIYRNHMPQETREWPPYSVHRTHYAVNPIHCRHYETQDSVQYLRRHPPRHLAVQIAESIPRTVGAVEPDSQSSTRLQVLRQRFDGLA